MREKDQLTSYYKCLALGFAMLEALIKINIFDDVVVHLDIYIYIYIFFFDTAEVKSVCIMGQISKLCIGFDPILVVEEYRTLSLFVLLRL